MDLRRLRLLFELSRLGSMRAVAETYGLTTSTVSQQIAALARDVGTSLVEPDGRRVRLTPAGRRLADHAVTILAGVDAARADLDPHAEPTGTLRVGGFATAVRASLLPVMAELEVTHPAVRVLVHEHEPLEAFTMLEADELDLALTYDYNLAPAPLPGTMTAVRLWSTAWGLGVPAGAGRRLARRRPGRMGGARLDRELAQHRRRTGGQHPGLAGRLHPADRASDRQPRPGRGPGPGRSGDRPAARRPPRPARGTDPGAARPTRRS